MMINIQIYKLYFEQSHIIKMKTQQNSFGYYEFISVDLSYEVTRWNKFIIAQKQSVEFFFQYYIYIYIYIIRSS